MKKMSKYHPERFSVQKELDRIIDKLFLRFIPTSVHPNQVTIVRFVMVPVVYCLLALGYRNLALVTFIIAASTDFIDGAMARTRGQITSMGKVIDPIADKLLMMVVLLGVGRGLLIVKIVVVFLIFELLAVIMGALLSSAVGKPAGANVFGKIKFILQCIGAGLLLTGLLLDHNPLLITVATNILYVTLFFAILAGIESSRRKLRYILSVRCGLS